MTEYKDGYCIIYREGQLKALGLESFQDICSKKFHLSPESHLSIAETIIDNNDNVAGIHIEMKPGYENQINRYHAFIRLGEENCNDRFIQDMIMVPIYSSCIKDGVQHYEDSKGCVSWITDIYRYNVDDIDNISWG